MKAAEPTGGVLFEEEQYFPRWLMVLTVTPVMATIIVTVITAGHTKDYKAIYLALFIIVLLQFILFYIFLKVRLEKIVTRNGLYYRWWPLQKKYKVIYRDEIVNIELRASPLLKYGYGWSPGYGNFYNMSKGSGLQLYLSNGKKIFFSTLDPLTFEKAVWESTEYGKKQHT